MMCPEIHPSQVCAHGVLELCARLEHQGHAVEAGGELTQRRARTELWLKVDLVNLVGELNVLLLVQTSHLR